MSSTAENRLIYKRILMLLKPFTKKISVILICILACAGINVIYPLISKQIMDKGLLVENISVVIKLSILTLTLVIAEQVIGLLETKFFSYVNSVFQYSLLKTAFKHLLQLKLQYFNNTNFSEIMNNIGMDVGNISRICDRGTFVVISQVFRVIGGIIGLLLIDWKLTIVVIFIVPIRFILVKYLAKKRESMFKEYMEYSRDFSAWYGDNISGIKEIKLLGIHRIKIGEFIKKQRNMVKMNIKMAFLDKLNEYSERIIFQIITSSLYILGAYMVFGSKVTIGGLFAFLSYSAFVIGPISSIINISYNFSNIIPSAKRFFGFLDMETEDRKEQKQFIRVENKQVKGNITFENVSFGYRDGEKLLKNINLKINPGEKIAIIGANGCGKSTLINLLLRFFKPQEGRILIDGINISDIKLKDYRNLISVVNQDLYIFNTTIENNISIGTKADIFKIYDAAKKSSAHDFIEEMPMKYKSEVGRNGAKLSGGQRQKVAIARAFARESRLLILDEATANYDVESEVYLNKLLITGLQDKTVLVISHKPDILTKVDKIWMLSSGKITEYKGFVDFKMRCPEYMDYLYEEKSII